MYAIKRFIIARFDEENADKRFDTCDNGLYINGLYQVGCDVNLWDVIYHISIEKHIIDITVVHFCNAPVLYYCNFESFERYYDWKKCISYNFSDEKGRASYPVLSITIANNSVIYKEN